MSFLDTIQPFSSTELPEAMRKYSNWLKIAQVIYKIEDPNELLKVLHLELTTHKRRLVIERVYSRYSSLKSREEFKNLLARETVEVAKDPIKDSALRNWYTVNEYLKTQEFPKKSILELIDYERMTRRRFYIINRLFTKLQSLRKQQEKKELVTWKPKKQ